MNTFNQVSGFYRTLTEEEKIDLCEAVAEDLFFLEEKTQKKILTLLHKAEPELCERIRRINDFTTR